MAPIPTIKQHILRLLATDHLLSATALITTLKKDQPSLNKTTVYRALEQLLSEGEVCCHRFTDTEGLYELRGDHHDHLVCTRCGKVQTADCQVRLTSDPTFRIEHHHLTVFGSCSDCQQQTPVIEPAVTP